MKLIKFFSAMLFFTTAFSFSVLSAEQSAQPSEQQLEQFKKLPEAQQKALAKKYGIDLTALEQSKGKDSEDKLLTPSVFPRNDKNKIKDEEFQTDEEKFKPKSDEPKPFGYELFSGEPTTFTPSENALVPNNYIVGPGDTFTINLYGKESSSEEIEVDREGRLAIDKLQPVTVTGMEYSEVVKLIKTKVEKEMIGVESFVSMGKTRSIRVMVLGEAYLSGAYTIPALSSISHALFVSGGISEIGSLRNIQLKRAGKTVETLDLYDLLIKGDSSKDVILKPGDVVFIPTVGKQVTVDGEVRRPAIFELKNNESIDDLIAMAGGFNGAAYPQKTVVERFTGNSFKTILQIDLTNSNSAYTAKNGDKIKVPSSSDELNEAVTLLGAVTYPGNYSWKKGDKVSRLFSSIKSDLLPVADYEYALIVREINIKGDIEIHQFSPLKAIAHDPEEDLELQARDKVVVFSRFQSKEDEESALDSLALTKEQIKLREKIALWDEFEQKQFYEFIDLGDSLDKELAEQVAKEQEEEEKNKVTAITEILNKKIELEDDEYSYFSRERLLKPILAKLNQQSGYKSKVQVYAIRGEVYHEGIYPRPVNANIEKAIASAGGLKESAYLDSAEITRFSSTSSAMLEHVNVNLEEAVTNPSSEKFLVKSKDSINVYPIPNWQKGLKVSLYGEVKFPGDYDIRKGESLREVIKRAGGFTEFSYPEGAVFTRETLRFQQQQQLNKLSEDLRRDVTSKSFNSSITDSSLSYDDMNSLINDLAKVKAVGRLVINLPAIVEGKLDIPLEDSDTLYIPSKQNSINVVGEVNFSSSHLFDSSLSVDDYIERSGGFKQRADEERVYIIKASGLVKIPSNNSWFAVNRSELLEPGDTVVVPLDTEHVDNLTLWSTATQILYQMGVAVAAVGSL
ncbi:polysaccharide export outer membrane protein [Pseudoalteromonas paragorgicola KMM 3548]|nr:SLBB domain-containing protein [Pseudoalteromonas distincta]MBE3672525.1 polysaccharide export outer membrane protein [Pseudoalteromonas distincta KMM 3548]